MRYLLALAFLVTPLHAQEVKLQLYGGSQIVGISKVQEWPIKTKYGVLKIPSEDVFTIHFGLHYTRGAKDEIRRAIKALGSDIYAERNQASKNLISHGKLAIPFLVKHPDLEVTRRLQTCKETLLESTPGIDMFPLQDLISVKGFQVQGEIDLEELVIEHSDFGQVKLNLSKIKSYVRYGGIKTVTISAEEEWTKIEMTCSEQSTLNIRATGKVDLWPQGPGQYTAGPKGYNTAGKGGKFMAGALIMKIGESGEPVFVGDRAVISPKHGGDVYLSIVPNPWATKSIGVYEVTIQGD